MGIIIALFVTALVLILYGPWQHFVVAMTRQSLFAVRDRLFDRAAASAISFDDPAYRDARNTINAMIRFCHQATWFNFVIISVYGLRGERDEETSVIAPRRAECGRMLERHLRAASLVMVFGMLLRSPFLQLIISVLFPILLIASLLFNRMWPAVIRLADRVVADIRREALMT